MPIDILMPALSPTMEEGTLSKWLKKEGDKVTSGDVIAEIETDKATMEVEAVDEGVIGKLLVEAGTENVKVNTKIAILLAEGESADAISAEAPKADADTPAATSDASGGKAREASEETPVATGSSPSPASSMMTVPTFTLSVPSATRMRLTVPSSTASNSMVALSVSISAMMSPDFTWSPSLTSHLASVPSSMVGERAGILRSIAIG